VPVVFVTAMPADLLTTQLAGASYEGIIRKPFTIDEVLDTVQRHLPQPSREA
jgi:CheY-like chemotaxis protein